MKSINILKQIEDEEKIEFMSIKTKDNTEIYEYNDVFYFDGVNNDFEYRMEFGATGLPIKITTKPDVAKIEFRNVKII